METLGRDELERLMFFEQAREQEEQKYKQNNQDVVALTRWGGALLELAHFRQGVEAYGMIQEAAEKFKMALAIEPGKHDALWCLGNAYTSQGFLTTETSQALEFFEQATECFKKALQEEPTNDVYKKALEMTHQAPQLHAELQKQIHASQFGESSASATRPKSTSDFWYDVAGWVLLGGIIVGWVALARSSTPAQAPK
ncbi:probable mitochondrial import receptor subunit TOM20 [Coccomyxa sp. Obi]|nr:probable mitochondrial import receptor subunit TOM20 [Coccomyxa sp. Obi]